MGGIAGIIYPDTFQLNQRIRPMMQALQHRCNKDPDLLVYKNIELGSCGQPIASNAQKTVYASLDGQIENFDEVCNDLKLHGYNCKGLSYAEVIVAAYSLWGVAFIQRIIGQFAIVILETETRKILLFRDRIGKKPLYWYHDQNYFIFASELKSILASGLVSQTPALDAFSSYLQFGYIPQDMTPIKKVNKLLPAYYLQFNNDQSKMIEAYWSYSSYFEKHHSARKQTVIAKLSELLDQSVQNLIPKNESVGCFVSGGLGSASIAYYTKKNIHEQNVFSYSVGFLSQNEEDVTVAKEVSQILEIPNTSKIISPKNFLDNFPAILWHLDEPLADPNIVATWNLAELASKQTKTVFSGMGSDELLAGHSRYTLLQEPKTTLNQLRQQLQPYLHTFLLPCLKILYKPGAYTLLKKLRTNPWQFDYMRHNTIFDEKTLEVASPELAKMFDPEIFLHKFHNLSRIQSTLASYLYFDVKTRLPDSYILQYDRLTAAHNLTWNSPFLNIRIVEYLASLIEPESITEKGTAQFLKEILHPIFPEYIVNRPKRTRKSFLKSWADEPEIRAAFKLLPQGMLADAGLVSEKWLKEMTTSPEMLRQSFPLLWSILTLEIWFRLFITKPLQTSPPKISVLDLLNEK